jgi:hypothetical protein
VEWQSCVDVNVRLLESVVGVSLVSAFALTFAACGGTTVSDSGDAAGDSHAGRDAPAADVTFSDDAGTDTSPTIDGGPPVDAAMSVCPAVYSVYGDTDASDNLGHVNPTLYASGTCSGPTEQLSGLDAGVDASIVATDLKITLQQSSLRSGMFVTVIHQTTPFPYDLTTCLESAGHGTGSMPGPDMPGTAALVNDAEMESFPQVQLDTNFAGTDVVFDVSPTLKSNFALNSVSCTFTAN